VTQVGISSVSAGTFTFSDGANDDRLTLGNGTVTQTLSTGTALEGSVVAIGTRTTANFDRIGVQVTLAGVGATGATGDYTDGDLDGSTIVVEGGTGGVFQVGSSDSFINRLEVGIPDLRATSVALNLGQLFVGTIGGARSAISGIDQAIDTVSAARGDLGAMQNRLNFSIGSTEVEIENVTASDATIRDADIAKEVTEFTRSQLLVQTSNAMLVQANVTSIGALSLL
jgi:flagellin